MSDISPQLVREIFDQASVLPQHEREAFLRARCGDHVELRTEVESLLAAAQSAGEFLAGPTINDSESGVVSATPEPRQIGPYKLLQIIGEGGFGTVYLAEQEQPIRRRVALKIIKLGMDTRQVIARFEA